MREVRSRQARPTSISGAPGWAVMSGRDVIAERIIALRYRALPRSLDHPFIQINPRNDRWVMRSLDTDSDCPLRFSSMEKRVAASQTLIRC